MNHTSVITCFDPDLGNLISLCKTLLNQNSRILLVDNSENPFRLDDLNLESNELRHIKFNKNMGIAYAQNIGIKKALKDKSSFITFFDQDSVIEENFIKNILKDIKTKTDGIIAPLSKDIISGEPLPSIKLNKLGFPSVLKLNPTEDIFSTDIVISSGTTISSSIIAKIGFFNEALFIDHVDTEWCLRCKNIGVRIFITSAVTIKHSIGKERKKLGPITIQVHSPERCYFQMRNSLSLLKFSHVPKIFATYDIFSTLFNRMILIMISNRKREYLLALLRGLKDGLLSNVKTKSY